jgi:hypothetical protein
MTGVHERAGRPRLYRSPSALHAAELATAVLIGVLVLAIVPGRAQVVGYIFAPLWAAATWRAWRLGVHIRPDGITVAGALLSKRIAWRDIDRFEVRPWLRYPYQGHVVLKDERTSIPILAISSRRPKSERHRRQVQDPVDGLNEALARWRKAHRGSEENNRIVSSAERMDTDGEQ